MTIEELRTGDVISVHLPFVPYKPQRYIGAGIRKVTKSFYGHTAIFVSIWGEPYVLEMNPHPECTHFKKWCETDKLIKISRYKDEPLENERKMAVIAMGKQSDSNTKYDYSSLFFHQLIFQTTGVWIGRTNNNGADKKLYCSEYVAWCYNQYNGLFPDYYKVAPSVLSEYPEFVTKFEGKAIDFLK